ncbi:MAG: TOBE domain-containing protein [Actinobacteria bacterium]|nr:MAG: TOBE domain-containing protein [Actinomycetota bacterium]
MPRDRPRRVIALDTSNAHNGTVNPGRNALLCSCSCPRRGRLAGSVLPRHLSDQRDRPCHGRAAAFRPESVELGSDGLPARVEVVEELGADAYVFCLVELEGKEAKLVARVDSHRVPERGARVALRPSATDVHVFDAESGERLGN